MTFQLTKAQIYGIESEEPLNKRYVQKAILHINAANSDVSLDIGNFSGTFWTAALADGTYGTIAAQILKAMKAIQLKALSFEQIAGTSLAPYSQANASAPVILSFLSSTIAGGSATPTATVTGLLTSDSVLSVAQQVANANSLDPIAFPAHPAAPNALVVTYSADPGGGGKVLVTISRTAAAGEPTTGSYALAMDGTNTQMPSLTFAATNAPTSYDLILSWVLNPAEAPVALFAG